ncbi:hypothetical protein P7C70_g404, partial [Phenoliferia sp. Uapishka_3]
MSPTSLRSFSPQPQEVELVRALHEFVPAVGSTTCLSFAAGQIIRTLNKDGSGWWDGELEGRRGWFPSNYVEVMPSRKPQPSRALIHRGGATDTMRSDVQRRGSAEDRDAQASGPGENLSASSRPSPHRSFTDANTPADVALRRMSHGGVLESIQQAIALLQSSVTAGRISHFQPSTACVISSVRTVLSSTDCLTRESQVLKLHPTLVAERRRILGALASLVNQARRASSPVTVEDERGRYTARMLDLADAVEANVRIFLQVAAGLGVALTDRSMADKELDPTNTGFDPHGQKGRPTLRSAMSTGDLRGSNQTPLALVSTTELSVRSDPRTPSLTSDTATDSSSSTAGLITPDDQGLVIRTTENLLEVLTSIHDQLLSTIAAFIGHVHAHTRSSHSSSYAYLIDMTRETIEKVREVLVVVEAISSHREIMRGRSSELAVLTASREALYVATTSLVTAARIATSTPDGDNEDEEKRVLLSSATAVLRSGGDCVGSVKLCVANRSLNFSLELVLPGIGESTTQRSIEHDQYAPKRITESPYEPSSLVAEAADATDRRRGPHTLSMLGRKASSLSCLRDRYQDAPVPSLEEQPEPEEESLLPESMDAGSPEIEERARKQSYGSITTEDSRSSRSSPSVKGNRSFHTSRTSSRTSSRGENIVSSAPMSRGDSSRTSESATSSRSEISGTSTTGTSPRSSYGASVNEIKKPLVAAMPLLGAATPQSLSPEQISHPFIRKDSSTRLLERDYEPREISFNPDGHVTGGTLRCLIERMTLHDTTIDPTFSNTFFLTFRMFTTPIDLCEALYKRFEMQASEDLNRDELKIWNDSKATPVRLRVYNFFKTWIEVFWQPDTDTVVVESLLAFSRGPLAIRMASASQRLVDSIQKRAVLVDTPVATRPRGLSRFASTDRLRAGMPGGSSDGTNPMAPSGPSPIVSRGLLNTLRTATRSSLCVLDIDPLELARQLTIMESRLYCKIQPDELLGQEFSKKGSRAVNVRAMSTQSTRLTGWIAETILNEQDTKKRSGLLKYFIKLDASH